VLLVKAIVRKDAKIYGSFQDIDEEKKRKQR
jgi:hypothetical protein